MAFQSAPRVIYTRRLEVPPRPGLARKWVRPASFDCLVSVIVECERGLKLSQPRWNVEELRGVTVAARLIDDAVNKSDPVRGVADRITIWDSG